MVSYRLLVLILNINNHRKHSECANLDQGLKLPESKENLPYLQQNQNTIRFTCVDNCIILCCKNTPSHKYQTITPRKLHLMKWLNMVKIPATRSPPKFDQVFLEYLSE